MNVRKLRVKTKIIQETDASLLIFPTDKHKILLIPKRVVIKSEVGEFYSKKKHEGFSEWTTLHIDNDFLKNEQIMSKVNNLRLAGHLFIYGNRKFGIDFDAVITKQYSRPVDICFYCDEELIRHNKTVDHLIPKAFLRAYGIVFLEDNNLSCCGDCNSKKANLHPATFREYVKILLKSSPADKWRIVLKTLNDILIDKKDPFNN